MLISLPSAKLTHQILTHLIQTGEFSHKEKAYITFLSLTNG